MLKCPIASGCLQTGSVIGLGVVVPAVLFLNRRAWGSVAAQQARVLRALAWSAVIGTAATGAGQRSIPFIVTQKPGHMLRALAWSAVAGTAATGERELSLMVIWQRPEFIYLENRSW